MLDYLIIVPFWVIGSAVVGAVAEYRGRHGSGWLVFSPVLSPLIGIFTLLVFPSRNVDDRALEAAIKRSRLDVDCTQEAVEDIPTTEPDG
jgi:hypothetical protein